MDLFPNGAKQICRENSPPVEASLSRKAVRVDAHWAHQKELSVKIVLLLCFQSHFLAVRLGPKVVVLSLARIARPLSRVGRFLRSPFCRTICTATQAH